MGVGVFPPLELAIFSEPNYGRSYTSTSGKGEATQRTCSSYPSHKVISRGLFLAGNVADRIQEIQEAMTVFLTQPAKSVLWDGRGTVPRSALLQSILNEQARVSPMMPAAEK